MSCYKKIHAAITKYTQSPRDADPIRGFDYSLQSPCDNPVTPPS